MNKKIVRILIALSIVVFVCIGLAKFLRVSSWEDLDAYSSMRKSSTPWADFAFRRKGQGDAWDTRTNPPIHTAAVDGINYHVYGERLSDVSLVVGEINGKIESAFFSDGRNVFVFFGQVPHALLSAN